MKQISKRTYIFRIWVAVSAFPVFYCCDMNTELLRKVLLCHRVLLAQAAQHCANSSIVHAHHLPVYDMLKREECRELIGLIN